MNRLPIHMALVLALACSRASASRTLTFDDVASGTQLRYSSLYLDTYRVGFGDTFRATDYTSASWPTPPSKPNVLTNTGSLSKAYILFGSFTYSTADYDYLRSVRVCSSTRSDAQVRVTAYYVALGQPSVEVASVVIGGEGQSWENQYVEISSPGSSFSELKFEGVNSSSDLQGFCLDDMTINYVPEPSSLLALLGGVVALGTVVRRRKR